MVILITVLDILQYLKSFIGRSGFNQYLLETALQSTVFLNRFTVLVNGGGTYALHLAAGEGRLKHIGGIHRSWCGACTYYCMYLVNKQDDVRIFLELLNY